MVGPELLVNGKFSTGDLTGWDVTGIWSVTDNDATGTRPGAETTQITQPVTAVGETYRAVIVVTSITAVSLIKFGFAGTPLFFAAPGTYVLEAEQTAAGPFVVAVFAPGAVVIESVSIREVIPVGRFTIVLKDNDVDKVQFSLPTADMNAGNIATELAAHVLLESKILDVVLGVVSRRDAVAVVFDAEPVAAPSDPAAQTNIKWLVRYIDDVNSRPFTLTIGTADLTNQSLRMPNSTLWDPADVNWTDFVAAFEAVVLSEDGNAVSVQQVELLE